MDFLFLLKKLISALVMPPTSLFLLILIGLLFIKRWPRTALAVIWFSFLSLFVLSLPITANTLVASLNVPALDARETKTAKAIIVLGGGLRRDTPEYGDTLSSYALERVRYGAKLARETSLPVLVTGGVVYGGAPEGDVMAKVMTQEFNIAPRWIENRARDTKENMRYSAELLKQNRIKHVLLVTQDFHMRRALAQCRAAGLECRAAPVSSIGRGSKSWIEQLPNAGALSDSALAIHEIIGNLALRYM